MHQHEWIISLLAEIVDYLGREGLDEAEEILTVAVEQVAPLLAQTDDCSQPKPLPTHPILPFHRRSSAKR